MNNLFIPFFITCLILCFFVIKDKNDQLEIIKDERYILQLGESKYKSQISDMIYPNQCEEYKTQFIEDLQNELKISKGKEINGMDCLLIFHNLYGQFRGDFSFLKEISDQMLLNKNSKYGMAKVVVLGNLIAHLLDEYCPSLDKRYVTGEEKDAMMILSIERNMHGFIPPYKQFYGIDGDIKSFRKNVKEINNSINIAQELQSEN